MTSLGRLVFMSLYMLEWMAFPCRSVPVSGTKTQVPPTLEASSNTEGRWKRSGWRSRWRAAQRPAAPAPTTHTRRSILVYSRLNPHTDTVDRKQLMGLGDDYETEGSEENWNSSYLELGKFTKNPHSSLVLQGQGR